jgi:hypothetical protein
MIPKEILKRIDQKYVLEAHKEGRNWVSSQKALDDYLANRQRKRIK